MGNGLALVDQTAARQLVERVNRAGGTYHRLDMGDGLVIEGAYDISKYVHYYGLPSCLDGKAVLDVGTASGYFAIECARRGAQVTAIDIWEDTCLLNGLVETFGLDIRYVQKSIYDVDASFGDYDLVVCGSLILHLPDPFGAIQRIRSVCGGRAIVSTACTDDSATNPAPMCEFTGQRARESDYWAYWRLSAPALRKMFQAAGFARVEGERHFTLATEPGRISFATPHVVMSATI
jgi:2-polyprenyl-3-methyl-5-hydroxy-6-metoxy-1,4-benzoquinol methylase